jgi:hypothetical protein
MSNYAAELALIFEQHSTKGHGGHGKDGEKNQKLETKINKFLK